MKDCTKDSSESQDRPADFEAGVLVLAPNHDDRDTVRRYGLDAHHRQAANSSNHVSGRHVVVLAQDDHESRLRANSDVRLALRNGAHFADVLVLPGWGSGDKTLDRWCLSNDLLPPIEDAVRRLESVASEPSRPNLNGASPPPRAIAEPAWSLSHGADDDVDEPAIVAPEWPAPPNPDAYHGLAGDIVKAIAPQTEADPAALLIQLLVAFGNLIGRVADASVGAARHHTNEFVVLVGQTSVARKGTAWHEIKRVLGAVDAGWHDTRILGGLSSGEGLIYAVRDKVISKIPRKTPSRRIPKKTDDGVELDVIMADQEVVTDPGVDDKRLLVVEPEFGGVLKALGRDGNKLSAVIRMAWDGDPLATLTKTSPFRATNTHISIIGHITADELLWLLTQCDQANGLANRFVWVCCRRSKLLPFGGSVPADELNRLQKRLAAAAEFAKGIYGRVHWTQPAMDLWARAYPKLTGPRPGVLGMLTCRAEAHTLRFAIIYALLDKSDRIEAPHLMAALAVWDYCQRSTAYLFGNKLGDKDAEAILEALQSSPDGLTRTQIRRGVFSGNKPADVIAAKLSILLRMGLVRSESIETGGRPAERWFVTDGYAKDAENAESPPIAEVTEDRLGVNGVNGVSQASREGEEATSDGAASVRPKFGSGKFPRHGKENDASSTRLPISDALSRTADESVGLIQASSEALGVLEEGEI